MKDKNHKTKLKKYYLNNVEIRDFFFINHMYCLVKVNDLFVMYCGNYHVMLVLILNFCHIFVLSYECH